MQRDRKRAVDAGQDQHRGAPSITIRERPGERYEDAAREPGDHGDRKERVRALLDRVYREE